MQFLMLVTIPDPEAAKPHLAGHHDFLLGEYASRHFLTFGPIMPLGTAGFILAEYDSRQAAEAAVARDPLVTAGAAVYDIREIAIGKNQLEKL